MIKIENAETFNPLGDVSVDMKLPGLNDYQRLPGKTKSETNSLYGYNYNFWGDDFSFLRLGGSYNVSSQFEKFVSNLNSSSGRYQKLSNDERFSIQLRFSRAGFDPVYKTLNILNRSGSGLSATGNYTDVKIESPTSYNPSFIFYIKAEMKRSQTNNSNQHVQSGNSQSNKNSSNLVEAAQNFALEFLNPTSSSEDISKARDNFINESSNSNSNQSQASNSNHSQSQVSNSTNYRNNPNISHLSVLFKYNEDAGKKARTILSDLRNIGILNPFIVPTSSRLSDYIICSDQWLLDLIRKMAPSLNDVEILISNNAEYDIQIGVAR